MPLAKTLPIYIDIDGTLTDTPGAKWGKVYADRIEVVRNLIESGRQIVIWSGGGTDYARDFVDRHGLTGAICIGKPATIVDDNPDIRPRDCMKVLSPEAFFFNAARTLPR